LWRRMLQGREEGRDVSAAARAAHRQPVVPFTHSEFSCADVRHDVRTVKSVYDALIEAKRSCGEATRDLSFAKFHRLIVERTDSLNGPDKSDRVAFTIDVEGGRVSFKAKADQ